MKLAIHFPDFTFPGEPASLAGIISATARAADEGGCETMTLMDHWFQMEQRAPATDPMLEGYTTLGFIAAQTTRLKLGLLVTGVTYRYPGLLAKIVATLDVLSEGRAFLGIGAAWYEKEHRALGVPYPPIAQRFGMLEEAIQICEQMWSDDDGPYEGAYYSLAETLCRPRPIQAPRPAHPHRRQR
ncbi:MAG: LLM class flavin-dependent oxidoreductase [Galbitalea sp.]